MRLLTLLGGVLGIALAAWLLHRVGLQNVWLLLSGAGVGILPVIGFHGIQIALSGASWRVIAGPAEPKPDLGRFMLYRWIREGVNTLLPVAQIGGEFVGARLLRRGGLSLVRATASTVCDLTAELVTQILFTVTGLLVLLAILGRSRVTDDVAGGLAFALLGATAFVAGQWLGLASLIERALMRLAAHFGWSGVDEIKGLHETIGQLYRARRQVGLALLGQSVSWLLGTIEVWMALRVLGRPTGLGPCLVLESLNQAVRSASFVVPGSLGVSEGGWVVIGGLFGLSPQMAIALSLLRRLREVVFGVPSLVAWQWLERAGPGPAALPTTR